jgi:hypothetical protein
LLVVAALLPPPLLLLLLLLLLELVLPALPALLVLLAILLLLELLVEGRLQACSWAQRWCPSPHQTALLSVLVLLGLPVPPVLLVARDTGRRRRGSS